MTRTARPSASAPAESPARRPGIPLALVIEGDPSMNRAVAETLAPDFDLITARDGREGLAKAEAHRPDVIVADVTMPGTGGGAMVDEFRRRPGLEKIPVLVLTARADYELRVDLLRAGAEDCVVKPFLAAELRARALNLARRRRSERDLEDVLPALRESEARFRSLAETATDAIISADERGEIVYFNPAAEKLFGHAARDVLGRSLTLLMPERFHAAHLAGLERYLSTGRARVVGRTVELAGRRKDGSEFPLELSLGAWKSGTRSFFTAILHDISERKALESRSRDQERYRTAVAAAPTAMLMVDPDGRIVLANDRAEQLFGYGKDELVGAGVEDLVPQKARGSHAGYRAAFMASPQAREMGAGRDLYAVRKDGTEVPVEIGLNPVRMQDGVFVLAAVVDITERRKSEERFRTAVESSPSAMLMVDGAGRIVLANAQAERLFGYARRDLLGESVERLVPPSVRDRHPGYRTAFFAAPQVRPMGEGRDLFALRKDGVEIPVEIGLNPIQTREGAFVLASIVDITERRKAETAARERQAREAAEAANRELESFSYSVSHDLRTPLRSISGFSAALVEDCAGALSPEGLGHLQRILSAVERMSALIDGLLGLSRLSRESMVVETLDLSAMAWDIIGELRRTQPNREVEVDIEPGLEARGDRAQLKIALQNLLDNAWKFTARTVRPRIEFRSEREGERRVFVLRDNGAGYDMAYADKLFGAFQRLHGAHEFPGNGIGLATVQRVLHRHGGRIWAEGAVGRGAIFRFTL